MGRPKGSKNRQDGATAVVEATADAQTGFQPDLVLTIRRLRIGSFTGLWELAKVNPDGTIKVISDANTKQIIVNLARNEILRCGQ